MKIGVLGGGQLGRMLALAGYPLGLEFRFLDPAEDAPAADLAEAIDSPFDDPAVLDEFANDLHVVTYEFENVPVASVEHLQERVPVYPPPAALAAAQDRLSEKTLFADLGIPVPKFAAVSSREELHCAMERVGLPAVLKTRRFGYDGKGQRVIREAGEIDEVWQALGKSPLILEQFVPFDRELSILAVRSRAGETAFYPLVENHHGGGILRLSLAPAPSLTPALGQVAEDYARRVLERVDYVGVLAIEFFERDGGLIANEMAPRVHNSGHWTIEGAETSQFENHLRAVLGYPLGPTTPIGVSAMVNLIGETPKTHAVLAIEGAHLHLYGKAPRPGRKLGHVTVRADDDRALESRLRRVQALVPDSR